MKKTNKIDDNIIEILLGSILIGLNNFNDGLFVEKIFTLLGFVILIFGIIRTILKYKDHNKKGMIIFLIIIGLIFIITFISLLCRLF